MAQLLQELEKIAEEEAGGGVVGVSGSVEVDERRKGEGGGGKEENGSGGEKEKSGKRFDGVGGMGTEKGNGWVVKEEEEEDEEEGVGGWRGSVQQWEQEPLKQHNYLELVDD